MHELAFPLLVGLILVALAFDYLNGLHDAANSIATVVATRLLSPVRAVIFAAFFNFAAYFLTIALTRHNGKTFVRAARRAGKDEPRTGVTVAERAVSASGPVRLRIAAQRKKKLQIQ